MSFWEKFFGRKKNNAHYTEPEEGKEAFSPTFRKKRINIHDAQERENYIKGCLMQIADVEKEMHQLEYEYDMVNSHLTDMEELDNLPEERRESITDAAKRLHELETQQAEYQKKKDRLTDEEFSRMERLEEEAESGIRKLKEAEDYQRLVKSDLRKLNGERHAYEYRLEELRGLMKNYTGAATICLITMGVCLLILFILQMTLQFDTKLGYVLVVCAIAVVMLRLFLKHNESQKEISHIEKDLNRLILLQNTVKIRYVNNKNLLDYLCLKFHVKTGNELETLWTRYLEEKREREQMARASKDFVYYQKELLRLLREAGIKDTSVWLHQTAAILDKREMVELRHSLIGRRKSLRDQMEYNKEIAGAAQAEVKGVSEEYPRYRKEILDMIEEVERGN